MINLLEIKSKILKKLERLQQDYQCFKDNYQLIALNLGKQKKLDADPRAIQQIEFYEMLRN